MKFSKIVNLTENIFRAKMILMNYTDAAVYGLLATDGGILMPHYILREYIVFIIDILHGNYTFYI